MKAARYSELEEEEFQEKPYLPLLEELPSKIAMQHSEPTQEHRFSELSAQNEVNFSVTTSASAQMMNMEEFL